MNETNTQPNMLLETANSDNIEPKVIAEDVATRGETAALDFLQIPQVKGTVSALRSKLQALESRTDITSFMKKLMLKNLAIDYKRLELMAKNMFYVYSHARQDADNIQLQAELENAISEIVDYVHKLIEKHNIDIDYEMKVLEANTEEVA